MYLFNSCSCIHIWSHSLIQPLTPTPHTNIPYRPHFVLPASKLHTCPGPSSICIPSSLTPLSLPFQSPSIWASESGRAPDPQMRLGCEGAEPSRPGRGGASAAGGGTGLRLPGPFGRAFPPVLHPWSSRSPGGLRGRGLPAAQRAGPEQRREVQAPVGGTVSL